MSVIAAFVAFAGCVSRTPAPHVLVVYDTETGYTRTLGEAIAAGAAKCGAAVRTLSTENASWQDIEWGDAIVLGSPTHFGNPSAGLLGWVEKVWSQHWTDPSMSSKLGAVFATGWVHFTYETTLRPSYLSRTIVFFSRFPTPREPTHII